MLLIVISKDIVKRIIDPDNTFLRNSNQEWVNPYKPV